MAEKLVRMVMTYVIQKGDGPLTLERLQTQREAEAKNTLGQFVTALRQRADLDPSFDERLKEFLKFRNQFVHNLDSVPGLGFDTFEGLAIAEAYTLEVATSAKHTLMVFTGLARRWSKEIGMRDDFADNEYFAEIAQKYELLVDSIFFAKYD